MVWDQGASPGQNFRWWGRPLDFEEEFVGAGPLQVQPNDAPPRHGEILVFDGLSSGLESSNTWEIERSLTEVDIQSSYHWAWQEQWRVNVHPLCPMVHKVLMMGAEVQ